LDLIYYGNATYPLAFILLVSLSYDFQCYQSARYKTALGKQDKSSKSSKAK